MKNLLLPVGKFVFRQVLSSGSQGFQALADLQSGKRAGSFPEDVEFTGVPKGLHTGGVIFGKEGVLVREVFQPCASSCIPRPGGVA
eukprot:14268595-Heterocapsa_arctica.AAC.1